jgi:hypothetical protein
MASLEFIVCAHIGKLRFSAFLGELLESGLQEETKFRSVYNQRQLKKKRTERFIQQSGMTTVQTC